MSQLISPPEQAGDLLQNGIAALKAGDHSLARKLLMGAARTNPGDERVWLYLAAAVRDPAQRRDCLERALRINPQSIPAQRGLAALATPKVAPVAERREVPPQPPIPAPTIQPIPTRPAYAPVVQIQRPEPAQAPVAPAEPIRSVAESRPIEPAPTPAVAPPVNSVEGITALLRSSNPPEQQSLIAATVAVAAQPAPVSAPAAKLTLPSLPIIPEPQPKSAPIGWCSG
ncbi:MAG: hypothetical protein HC822_03960 [Oscillochloris sp.]|nr:hypothetical protein [Oscillochloris sp.]